jgi:hypothetical protein
MLGRKRGGLLDLGRSCRTSKRGGGVTVKVKAVTLFRANSPRMFVSFRLNPHTPSIKIDPGSAAFAADANALSPLSPVSDEQACSSVDLLAGFRNF